MKGKIILFLFITLLFVGIVFSAGETATPVVTTNTPGATSSVINVGDESKSIGDLVGDGLDSSNILVKLVNFVKKGNGNTLISFLQGGNAVIGGFKFENITESSSIELDNSGEIEFADLTASKDTSFNFKGVGEYKLMKGQRIKYENGKLSEISAKSGDSIKFKPEFLDESGNNIGRLMNIKLVGDSLGISKDTSGNFVMNGNFNLGNDKIIGVGDNIGKVTFSKDGKISEVWKGTDATIDNVNFKVSGDSLKMYSDKSFNPANHKGENYFTYGDGKIYTGGDGFIFDLTKSNAFGNMRISKQVVGIGTKTRDLEITMNGGNLQISKDITNKNDLGFNIQSSGKFIINNGRNLISSDGSDILVKSNVDEKGLLSSYDLNFNSGQYQLKSNVFTNKDGTALINTNKEWEDIIRKINLGDYENTDLKEEIDSKTGVDSRNYVYLLKNREAVAKWICEARDSANSNNYGTKISFDELFTRYMLEGGAKYNDGYPIYDFDNIGPNVPVFGSKIGLDNIGNTNSLKKLKSGGFIPQDFQLTPAAMTNELNQDTTTADFKNMKDSLTAFAGELTRRKYVFENDFKTTYGEDQFKIMSDDEKYFWLTYYFNAGEGAGKGELTATKYNTNTTESPVMVLGKGRENVYKPWTGPEPGRVGSNLGIGKSARFNSLLSEATYALMKGWGLFSYI